MQDGDDTTINGKHQTSLKSPTALLTIGGNANHWRQCQPLEAMPTIGGNANHWRQG